MQQKDPASTARRVLDSEEVLRHSPQALELAVAGQGWAMLAVAEAINRLASAVEALQAQ